MNLVKRSHSNGFPVIMDEFFKDLLGGTQYAYKTAPPVNIIEGSQFYTLELIVPGRKKDDFTVEVENGHLIIANDVKAENITTEEGKYTRREFTQASFKRSFVLPETVNEEGVNAVYQEGILKVTLPKKEAELPKAKKYIDIS